MKEFIIETQHLTKQYGQQKSVSDLNIHVRPGTFMVCWVEMVQVRQQQ